jgi:hypothetical protein
MGQKYEQLSLEQRCTIARYSRGQGDEKPMRQKSFLRFPGFHSGNLKPVLSQVEASKTCPEQGRRIENLKWLGLIAIGVAFAMCGAVAHAQQAGKILRISFLDNSTASGSAGFLDAFRQELSKLGWSEGKNIAFEYRFAEEKNDRLPELTADLVRLKVDLIVVSVTPAALRAKSATTTIPIVMANSSDPVGAGLVASLGRPGGNVTGLSGLAVELNTKRLEILKDAVPRLARVGLPRSPGASIGRDLQLKELRPAALALKLKLEEIETQADAKGLESAFKTAKQKQGRRDYDDRQSPLFRRKKADRRACRQISVAGYLFPEGVCR